MPSLSFAVAADDSLVVPAAIGLSATAMNLQIQAGQAPARPIHVNATIDTGATAVAVSSQLLNRLGIPSHKRRVSITAGGSFSVDMYWISLFVFGPASFTGPVFSVLDVEASALLVPVDIDLLIGMNALLQCQFHLDGPARQFTLTF